MAKLKAERLAASGGEGADADAPVAAGNKLVVDDAAADGAAAVDAEGNQGGGSSSSSSSSSEAEPSFKPTAPVSEVVAAKEPKKSAKKKKRKSGHKASATPAAAPSTDSDSDDVFSERKPKVKPASSSSSSSSSDSENEAVASAAVPARTTHRPGVGSELTDHPVVRQLFDELAAVRAEGALMRQQMRALGERVSTMATELAVLRSAPADCDADAAAADRWPWQSVEGPQRSVTLLDRKRELQQQAAPGISDAAAKVAWSQEWTALTRVLEGFQGGDSPPAHMGDAVASGAGGEDAAASDVGFILVVGGRTGTLDPVAYVEQLNLATGEWTVADALVEPRFGLAAAADGRGSAFAIAGSGSRSTNNASVKTVERYDVAAGRWELGQPCSTSRAGAAAVAFEGELYVLGSERCPLRLCTPQVCGEVRCRGAHLAGSCSHAHVSRRARGGGVGSADLCHRGLRRFGHVPQHGGAVRAQDEYVVPRRADAVPPCPARRRGTWSLHLRRGRLQRLRAPAERGALRSGGRPVGVGPRHVIQARLCASGPTPRTRPLLIVAPQTWPLLLLMGRCMPLGVTTAASGSRPSSAFRRAMAGPCFRRCGFSATGWRRRWWADACPLRQR